MTVKNENKPSEESMNDRIYALIKALGYNPTSFSKALNMSSNSIILNIVSGRRSKPSADTLSQIVQTFDSIDGNWLLSGDGSMFRDKKMEYNNQVDNHFAAESLHKYTPKEKDLHSFLVESNTKLAAQLAQERINYKELSDNYNELSVNYNELSVQHTRILNELKGKGGAISA